MEKKKMVYTSREDNCLTFENEKSVSKAIKYKKPPND